MTHISHIELDPPEVIRNAELSVPKVVEQDDGRLRIEFPDDGADAYLCSIPLMQTWVNNENDRRDEQGWHRDLSSRYWEAVNEPHLDKATTQQLREALAARARARMPWNRAKTVHPTNGHGTWLPVYWTASRDAARRVSVRYLLEIDHPYRRGRGVGVRLFGVLVEVGVCYRKNLEPDPDRYNEFDDPGTVDAVGARVLDDGIAAVSTKYRGPHSVASTPAEG